MLIHVVKPGESLYTISNLYKVSPNKIISSNELTNPNSLVPGQTLVIPEGTRTHTVSLGESLYSIARRYGVNVNALAAANPTVGPNFIIRPGQVLTIPERPGKLGTIEVNGFTFPTTNMDVIRKTLPNLTYLSIFSYTVNPDGTLNSINDVPLIQAARNARVAPMMVITNIAAEGGFSSVLARTILTNPQIQDTLLNNIISTLTSKNYSGLDIDFEYIFPANREDYNNFLRKASARLKREGYILSTSIAPKTSAAQKGLLYEAHDYPVHGALVDHVIIMTYEWGYTFGPPLAVAPVNEVEKVIRYAVTAIPSRKIFMGVPNYGYDWTLPYTPGTAANVVSNTGAVDLARRVGAEIKYDTTSQAPYFNYYDASGKQHVVWFDDARSIYQKLLLINKYNLGGASYWTIGRYFPQNWLILNSLYNVRKIL